MRKDKKWLEEEIDVLKHPSAIVGSDDYEQGMYDAFSDIENLIKQLDEPRKPVIPQFVADYIEKYKKIGFSLETWLNFADTGCEFESKTEEWLYGYGQEEKLEREYLLVDAIRYGYEVEKEPLYYVRENNYLLCEYNGEVMDYVEAVERGITDLVELKLTKKEITDYDERYLVFAEEVKR